ncbi:hypothetical protein ACL02R_20940 [Streptomyces sp. MS19]|uniref:hypothetical protein n=1 Tax=Streptomyces sp. MS19 TaxID=3385972 RepID=UPI0039A38327
MISKGRHQSGDVASVLDRARKAGLTVVCPCKARFTVSGTPKNAGNEARRVNQFVDDHTH